MLTAKTAYGTLTIGRTEYVVIPKADYLRLQNVESESVDAHTYVRQSIADGVRQAREHAGLTQAELAALLKKSQTMVSQAESGAARVSERYVKAVLKACCLPENWTGPADQRKKTEKKRRGVGGKGAIGRSKG